MSILYCLNPECSHPQNPTHYKYCQGCGGDLSQTIQSYSFHNRYLIVGVLGEAAFSRTYQAEDLNFNRKPCVIKKFIVQMQGDALEKSEELFQREAEKLDELKHEQIPTVYDHFSEGNSLYLVQEFIEGETLSSPPNRTINTTSGITRRKWLYNGVGMIIFAAAITLVINKRDLWQKLLPSTSPSDKLIKPSPSDKPITSSPLEQPKKPTFTEKLPRGLQLEMVELLGGEFMMGSPESDPDAYYEEKPQHQVKVNSFAIGKYPVTQAQYQAVMGTNPSLFANNPQNPVEKVSWNNAQAFCQKLSQITGKTYRLPTEAEWEYACRAGTTTRFYFGDDANQLEDYAWYKGNSQRTTHPVGQKKPNAWGLHDISGNVWEWCEDHWHDSYKNAPGDGSAWLTNDNSHHIIRGGSWLSRARNCRSAYRLSTDLRREDRNIGFRVVCSAPKTS